MKKFLTILKCAAAVFVGIIAIVFIFVELRPIFAGDFKLFESPVLAFFKYFFRAILYIFMLVNVVKVFYCAIKHRSVDLEGLIFNGMIVLATTLTFAFYEWYIALILLVLNLGLFAIRVFNAKKEKPQQVAQQ